ncbi:transketolase C-terminal domain-containing protein [Megasphaera paucivorans]|uniref:Pyruvate ferredoxin oxidoreductase alpha subunit n=1 Tax=Megasphaera paucivorans TaxID=349095 RepID=A0A1G9WX16_9FIRM|nr:transketolase C-terminal domain-containing protein [Megasphaera paucivorans]SDM88811.1 pyruvate ferredoxin oxidoreductase alpha subunit [Megasphaera paucivorans]
MTNQENAIHRTFISGNDAVAYGVQLCRPEVIASYPITPQTTVVEKLSELVANGELDCQYFNVESEHSAMAATMGAAMTGCRTFTATSSQGLLYMCEMLNYVSGSRFPIVMMNANRTIAAPWNIYGDHRDSMAMRDSGWMQVYVEDGQEALDSIIQAYKLAENCDVSTPVMVCVDGFVLTHTYELVKVPKQEEVDAFLPKYTPTDNILDLDHPRGLCISVSPEWQTEFRYQQYKAMEKAKEIIPAIDQKFNKAFGRFYGGLIEAYKCDDAEYVLVGLGSVTGTMKIVADSLREEGIKAGVLKIRFYRPFPNEAIQNIIKNQKGKVHIKAIGVIDKAVSFGNHGPVYSDVKAALSGFLFPKLNFIAGLSGRDIKKEDIKEMYQKLICVSHGEETTEIQFTGLRWKE